MPNTHHPKRKGEAEQLYHVLWEIDIGASSPKEAAEKALAIQRDPQSLATVFDVADESGALTRIDLDDLESGDESE